MLRSVRLTLDLFASGSSGSVISSCSGVDSQVHYIIPALSVCLSFILCMWLFNGFWVGSLQKLVLWKCSVLAALWVIWLETNRRIFEDSEKDIIFLWESVWLIPSLRAQLLKEFQDSSFFFIHLNWESVLA